MSTPDSNTPSSSDETGDSQEASATVIGMAEASRNLDTTRANPDPAPESDAADTSDAHTKGSGRRLPALLAILLLLSVAMNFWQSEQQQNLSRQSAEVDLALDRAMERIDAETGRANLAEETLTEIDRSVDTVQERIADLQSALTSLSEAAAR